MTDSTGKIVRKIIRRLEKATGPCRAFDCKIWLALFDKQIMVDGGGYSPNARPPKYESARKIWTDDWPGWAERTQVEHGVALELGCPRYTASLDAALTLARHQADVMVMLHAAFKAVDADSKPNPPNQWPSIQAALIYVLRARSALAIPGGNDGPR